MALVAAVIAWVSIPKPALHTDAEIREIAEKHSEANDHFLDVVPLGESRRREQVFVDLGIEQQRLRKFRIEHQINMGAILAWQVSPTYDITCITATNEPDNEGLQFADPKRKVYGVSLVKRR